MSVYVMADIHGEYNKFLAILELINFNDADELFILGDIIDRGPDPIKLVKDLSFRNNVFCLLGNHELMAIDILKTLLVEINAENFESHIDTSVINKLMEYQSNGGDTTLKQFKELPNEERVELLNFLKEFELHDVVDVGDKTFILSHTGNITNKKLSEHSVEELTFIRADYDKQVFTDPHVYLVCGHTPTLAITGKPEIYYKNKYINLDCGATFDGGKLACLRLDDLKEFYI